MKFVYIRGIIKAFRSPLAEGRELKYCSAHLLVLSFLSPLAEGRELKLYVEGDYYITYGRPSRRGVN